MKSLIIILGLAIFPFIAPAQEIPATKDLRGQYQDLKNNSETFNQYKVIPETDLDNWFKIIQDTLSVQRSQINSLQSSQLSFQDTISMLRNEQAELQSELDQSDFEKTHIAVFGIDFSKGVYKAFTIAGILGLIIVIFLLVIRIIDKGRTTRETIKLHDSLTAEFEEYKRRALDKQTKLARDLQTARNKLEEIKKRR